MKKKKIEFFITAALIINFSSTSIKVLADEISKDQTSITKEKSINGENKAIITKYNLFNSKNIDVYNELFKMDNQNIASITNNGGNYSGSTIDKAIDGDFNIHWETGRENSSEFTNEVEIDFKEAG